MKSFLKPGGGDARATLEALGRSLAIIEFKPDGTILTANANFLDAMGYDLAEISGRHHSLFVDPAERDSDSYRQFWAKLGRGEFNAAEFRRIAKGGREIWIQASYNPILDGSGKGLQGRQIRNRHHPAKAQCGPCTGADRRDP